MLGRSRLEFKRTNRAPVCHGWKRRLSTHTVATAHGLRLNESLRRLNALPALFCPSHLTWGNKPSNTEPSICCSAVSSMGVDRNFA